MIVGIDARLALGRGRGWGRYAAELILELSRCHDDGTDRTSRGRCWTYCEARTSRES